MSAAGWHTVIRPRQEPSANIVIGGRPAHARPVLAVALELGVLAGGDAAAGDGTNQVEEEARGAAGVTRRRRPGSPRSDRRRDRSRRYGRRAAPLGLELQHMDARVANRSSSGRRPSLEPSSTTIASQSGTVCHVSERRADSIVCSALRAATMKDTRVPWPPRGIDRRAPDRDGTREAGLANEVKPSARRSRQPRAAIARTLRVAARR